MKKLLLTASILAVSAGNAFAQVTPDAPVTNFAPPNVQLSDIVQTGDENIATVDQTGGSEGVSDINQSGDANVATVTQSETSGASNTFSTPANIADIDQIGEPAVQLLLKLMAMLAVYQIPLLSVRTLFH